VVKQVVGDVSFVSMNIHLLQMPVVGRHYNPAAPEIRANA